MNPRTRTGRLLAVLALLVLASACDTDTISQGASTLGFNTSVEAANRAPPFHRFAGDHVRGRVVGQETEETRRYFGAEAGDEIALDYDVSWERGRIAIVVEEAIGSRTLWEVRVERGGAATVWSSPSNDRVGTIWWSSAGGSAAATT